MTTKELRLSDIEQRDNQDGEKVLTGYAVKWDSPTNIGGQFQEEFTRGAFSKALGGSDIRALVDHDMSKVLGRNRSGTLRLQEDDIGLRVDISPPDTQVANDLLKLVERGDVSGMSFGFQAREQRWDHKTSPSKRTVTDAELFEVSVVTFPAYPDTTIALRSLENDKAKLLRERLEAQLKERLKDGE